MARTVLRRSSRLQTHTKTLGEPSTSTRVGKGKKSARLCFATVMRKDESILAKEGFDLVAGTDEAGRGPLAGPVIAAACHVPLNLNESWVEQIADSKVLSEKDRERLYQELTSHPKVIWAVGMADSEEIDEVNILQSSMLSMHRAVIKLPKRPDFVLVDGNRKPWGHPEAKRPNGTVRKADPPMPKGVKGCRAIIKGDKKVLCIAAASIIAKVTRDRIMYEYDKQFPRYGFSSHKGYPTKLHMSAISKYGPLPIHRLTFAPLKGMQTKKSVKR